MGSEFYLNKSYFCNCDIKGLGVELCMSLFLSFDFSIFNQFLVHFHGNILYFSYFLSYWVLIFFVGINHNHIKTFHSPDPIYHWWSFHVIRYQDEEERYFVFNSSKFLILEFANLTVFCCHSVWCPAHYMGSMVYLDTLQMPA